MLFCIARKASAWPALSDTTRVRLHLVGANDEDLARHFATSGGDRSGHAAISLADGLTAVAGAVARLDCHIVDRIPAGDHHIVLAAPMEGGYDAQDQHSPLLYSRRRYTREHAPDRGPSCQAAVRGPGLAGRWSGCHRRPRTDLLDAEVPDLAAEQRRAIGAGLPHLAPMGTRVTFRRELDMDRRDIADGAAWAAEALLDGIRGRVAPRPGG